MKKRIGTLLVLVALSLVMAACGGAPQTGGDQQPAAPAPEPGVRVTMSGFAFQPAEVTVSVGDTVTWLNNDEAAHTVTGDGGIDSPQLARGEQYSKTFDTAGTFSYSCTIHPSMTGTVVVK